jgi:hypothetical protein
VELDYAAAAALASESHREQRAAVTVDVLDHMRRDAARSEADEAAAAREWTRRLIESGSGTCDDDDSDLEAHQWGGDAEIIDDKVVLIIAFFCLLLIDVVCRAPPCCAKVVRATFFCDCSSASALCALLLPTPRSHLLLQIPSKTSFQPFHLLLITYHRLVAMP